MTVLDRINAHRSELHVRRAALTLAALPFYVPGWLAGWTVRAMTFVAAAIVAGYKSGAGIEEE